MFKIESYVTPILLSYVDKYVKDFNPADAQVSLWGGGVALQNLVIKTDVVQQEVGSLPFTLVSGRIHELLIQVPWTKIMSEPIVVTIDIIECILSFRPPQPDDTQPVEPTPAHGVQHMETPPGYMQALVRRIVSNITIKVHHLILKYVQDDVVMSLNVKHLSVQSTGNDWKPAFADIDQKNPEVRRLVTIDDLTLCLDRSEADGKIRFYQDPLLYRCRIELRVLIKLVSANIRRASRFQVDVSSDKLAFSVTNEQLLLLLKLVNELSKPQEKTPKKKKPAERMSDTSLGTSTQQSTTQSSEPHREDSWSTWAWSWLPTLDRRGPADGPPAATPASTHCTLRLQHVHFAFKRMEQEASGRKRTRSIIDLSAIHTAVKAYITWPTLVRAKLGVRSIFLKSSGACVCGHVSYLAQNDEPMIYVSNATLPEPWEFPEDSVDEAETEETAGESELSLQMRLMNKHNLTLVEEAFELTDDQDAQNNEGTEETEEDDGLSEAEAAIRSKGVRLSIIDYIPEVETHHPRQFDSAFWTNMAPVLSVSLVHERAPKDLEANPYENIPKDFEYSDWDEECSMHISLQPLDVNITMGLLHRMQAILDIFAEYPIEETLPKPRKLTVEENEALQENLPQRKITMEIQGLNISVIPKDHSLTTRAAHALITLDIDLPKIDLVLVTPLYPIRVCSAACQLEQDSSPIWRAASMHLSATMDNVQVLVSSAREAKRKPCGRFDLRFVVHSLLCKPYFQGRSLVQQSYMVKIQTSSIWRAASMHLSATMENVQVLVSSAREAKRKPCGRFDLRFVVHSLLCKPYFQGRSLVQQSYMVKIPSVHLSATMDNVQVLVSSAREAKRKPCGRFDLRFVVHSLLCEPYFQGRSLVQQSYMVKIREVNISGSAPRLTAAAQVLLSFVNRKNSMALRYSSLPKDALDDEDLCVLDVTAENLILRNFKTSNVNTTQATLQTLRATLCQPQKGQQPKQAWLFSGPDAISSVPFLRVGFQTCEELRPENVDYFALYSQHAALALDPIIVAWLSYKPSAHIKDRDSLSRFNMEHQEHWRRDSSYLSQPTKSRPSPSKSSASQPPPSTEQVHARRNSQSSSGPSASEVKEKKSSVLKQPEREPASWWCGDYLPKLHGRLRKMLLTVDMGLMVMYVPRSTVSAVNCATISSAMEGHGHTLLLFSLGRWTLTTNLTTNHLWHYLEKNGPTYKNPGPDDDKLDSFPWKMTIADMSCYLMAQTIDTMRTDKPTQSKLKSRLKNARTVQRRNILELVTTSLTLSVVTKNLQHKIVVKKADMKSTQTKKKDHSRLRWFNNSPDFRPTTLNEFLRGPKSRKKDEGTQSEATSPVSFNLDELVTPPVHVVAQGPMVSLGFHLHADTPPLVIHLEEKQVPEVAATFHCLQHLITLIKSKPAQLFRVSKRTLARYSVQHSTSALDIQYEDEGSPAESVAEEDEEMLTIYQRHKKQEVGKLKTFLFFQWVINRATVVASTDETRIVFNIEDIISSIDLQHTYNQLKIKVATASIRHFQRNAQEQWVPGVLSGRVVEARERVQACPSAEDAHFLCLTVTQAQICNLPPSWKQELHPKLLEQKCESDTMWEIYAVMAPLEVVILPSMIDKILVFVSTIAPPYFCDMEPDMDKSSMFDLPFVYLNMDGLRILVSTPMENPALDDAIIVDLGRISVNPHPDNPICRRPVACTEHNWNGMSGSLDGRQYELALRRIRVVSATFAQIVTEEKEKTESSQALGGENPAKSWGNSVTESKLTEILHPLDINVLIAPPLFLNNVLACGSAIELNLTSDCAIELSVEQIHLIADIVRHMQRSVVVPEIFALQDECPYAGYLESIVPLSDRPSKPYPQQTVEVMTATVDSGVDTATSRSTAKSVTGEHRKSRASVVPAEQLDPRDFKEICITMGIIELSLYVVKEDVQEVMDLYEPVSERVPSNVKRKRKSTDDSPVEKTDDFNADATSLHKAKAFMTFSSMRADQDTAGYKLVRVEENHVPLIHMALYQPNLYYWKRRSQINLQISVFNLYVSLGAGKTSAAAWHVPLVQTAKGEPDPETGIAPALFTLKYCAGCTGSVTAMGAAAAGTFEVDIERPLRIEITTQSLARLLKIALLLMHRVNPVETVEDSGETPSQQQASSLYRLKETLVNYKIEEAKITSTQIGICLQDFTLGWDSATLFMTYTSRPENVHLKALINAFVVSHYNKDQTTDPILQPVHLGCRVGANWDAWRRTEGPEVACQPSVYLNLDCHRLSINVTPNTPLDLKQTMEGLTDCLRIWEQRHRNFKNAEVKSSESADQSESATDYCYDVYNTRKSSHDDHYYKDDLRSGAFKYVRGAQLPTAYQVTLHEDIVAWTYPHPRCVVRLIAYPLYTSKEEVECTLEFFNKVVQQWEPYIYAKLPILDTREFSLQRDVHEMVFATKWRFRVLHDSERYKPFEFDMKRFMPTRDPPDEYVNTTDGKQSSVTAEELSSILQVDSYYTPRLSSQLRLKVRLAGVELHIHNRDAAIASSLSELQSCYVAPALLKSHRVLSVLVKDAVLSGHLVPRAGKLCLITFGLATYIVECSTGRMEPLSREFVVQAGVSVPSDVMDLAKLRVITGVIHVDMNIPRLRTLQSLTDDWRHALLMYQGIPCEEQLPLPRHGTKEHVGSVLEGRVTLWIHNSCLGAVRVRQAGTEERRVLPCGLWLAYRWFSVTAPKRLRFGFANAGDNEPWSQDVPFVEGTYRVRLENPEADITSEQKQAEILYVKVKQKGPRQMMTLTGRLVLANMLRHNLHYKVRARHADGKSWRTIASSELVAEKIGRSVICPNNLDLVLKIRLEKQNTGWSGDIPLKECPKENVPWLVKVPCSGAVPYISVWCRVVTARSDGRMLATVWPLYVMLSHLSLDIDVLVVTEMGSQSSSSQPSSPSLIDSSPAPVIQSVEGRGATTHLLCPGTTAARHTLSFQYRNIECPVTRDEVPLYYGVTDTSVFEKRAPVQSITEVLHEIEDWLKKCGKAVKTPWPYSIVTSHWPGVWKPALLQPRSEVVVRYKAVCAGGGCSLQIQISPALLLCNAAPVALTVRAHDAAPLCKLEPGNVIALPAALLEKPFFLSIEKGRETFVSSELRVATEDPGRYGSPPQRAVAIDHPATFGICCSQRITLLNLHYELKEEALNVLGVTAAYVLINELDVDLVASLVAVPEGKLFKFQDTYSKTVPAKQDGVTAPLPLVHFQLSQRWRGELAQLRLYLCVTLKGGVARMPAPVLLGHPPERRPIALLDANGRSMPVVVTQHRHEGRWVVGVHTDPCPQYVIHNRTDTKVAVAQPVAHDSVQTQDDCPGVKWRCVIDPGGAMHYSCPSYTFRPAAVDAEPIVYYLSFAKHQHNESEEDYLTRFCAPAAMIEGEQLVRLSTGSCIKMRVRTTPHSTLVELRDTDHSDLSALDIRGRLLEQQQPAGETSHQIIEDLISTVEDEVQDRKHVNSTEESEDLQESKKELEEFKTHMKNVRLRLDTIKRNLYTDDVKIGKKGQQIDESNPNYKENINNVDQKSDRDEESVNKNEMATKKGQLQIDKDGVNIEKQDAKINKNFVETEKNEAMYSEGGEEIEKDDIQIKREKKERKSDNIEVKIENNQPKIDKELVTFEKVTTNIDSDGVENKNGQTNVVKKDVKVDVEKKVLEVENDKNVISNIGKARAKTRNVEKAVKINEEAESLPFIPLETNTEQDKENTRSVDNLSLKNYTDFKNQSGNVNSSDKNVARKDVSQTDQDQSEGAIELMSGALVERPSTSSSVRYQDESHYDWHNKLQSSLERARCKISGIVVTMAVAGDAKPLLAAHVDNAGLTLTDHRKTKKFTVAISDVQLDNLEYESGQFDFAVIATTCMSPTTNQPWPSIWDMFGEHSIFESKPDDARVLLNTIHETWTVNEQTFTELTEVDFAAGPLALYIEDSYVKALAGLFNLLHNPSEDDDTLCITEAQALRSPLRLTVLNIHPLDLTLSLHTAVRMYIALDHSPLRLSAFRVEHLFTSAECLVHALTVHYLSATLLSAGWVVGGLEILGAPGALAARVGGATGGVRGLAQTAAAALLRSLSACAGSLARNLDLLAGDEEHAKRAAAARRRPPDSFVGGLVAGLTNFAINILGAVGGLAHHPLVGVAVGESGSSATALRRSLVGALAKPLSATADLVAYAGNGLLKQAGWDYVPRPRVLFKASLDRESAWQHECVRLAASMGELRPVAGFEALANGDPTRLLLTERYIVMVPPHCDRAVEMIDLRECSLGPYEGAIIELIVKQRRQARLVVEREVDEDDIQVNAAVMARVARYTGASPEEAGVELNTPTSTQDGRVLTLDPTTGQSLALHAILLTLIHGNNDAHFSFI